MKYLFLVIGLMSFANLSFASDCSLQAKPFEYFTLSDLQAAKDYCVNDTWEEEQAACLKTLPSLVDYCADNVWEEEQADCNCEVKVLVDLIN